MSIRLVFVLALTSALFVSEAWAVPGVAGFELGELTLPGQVKPGQRATACYTLTTGDLNAYLLLQEEVRGSLRFLQDGLLWHVEDFRVAAHPGAISTGQILAGSVDFQFPTGLPGGAYTVTLLVYGERMNASARPAQVQVKGPGTAIDPELVKNISHGTYVDMHGTPHQWWINRQNALIWEGKPYIPMGGMFCPLGAKRDEWVLRNMALNGVYDLYFNGGGPHNYVPLLEKLGMRYGWQFETIRGGYSGLWPMAQVRTHAGVRLPAFDYVADGQPASFSIPRAGYTINVKTLDAVHYAVFNPDRATVAEVGRFGKVELKSNSFEVSTTFKTLKAGERYQVVGLPCYTGKSDSFGLPNYWAKPKPYLTEVEKYVQTAFAKGVPFGPGFRCILEPTINETDISQDLEAVYFLEPNFIEEYEAWLKEKYDNPQALATAWALQGEAPRTFAEASRLIPLCLDQPTNGAPTICWLLDHQTHALYRAGYKKTRSWMDYVYFRDDNYGRVVSEICDMIRRYVDVPIVQKHVSVFKRYNVNHRRSGGLDGLGFETYMDGDGAYTFHSAAALSEANSGRRTIWTPLTEGSPLNSFVDQNPYWYNKPYWVSRREMATWADRLFDAGAKGLYVFLIQRPHDGPAQWTELFHQPIALQWLGELNDLANRRYAAQIAAFKPTHYVGFPARGNFWRPDMWESFYTPDVLFDNLRVFKGPNGMWVVPTDFPNRLDASVYFCNLRTPVVAQQYRSEFEQLLARGKMVVYVGYRDPDGTLSIDGYFGKTFEKLPDGRLAQELRPPEGAEILHRTPGGMVYGFRQGKLQIVATTIWNFTAKNPQEMDYARDDNPYVMPKPLDVELPGFDLRPYRFSVFNDAYSPSDAPVMEWDPLYRPPERFGGAGQNPWPQGR